MASAVAHDLRTAATPATASALPSAPILYISRTLQNSQVSLRLISALVSEWFGIDKANLNEHEIIAVASDSDSDIGILSTIDILTGPTSTAGAPS